MFRDTFAILSWEASGLWSRSALNLRQLRSGYNNESPDAAYFWWIYVLLEYTGCYLRYLVFVSNFGMCYNCTVSYRIVLRAYRDMYRSLCIAGVSFQP